MRMDEFRAMLGGYPDDAVVVVLERGCGCCAVHHFREPVAVDEMAAVAPRDPDASTGDGGPMMLHPEWVGSRGGNQIVPIVRIGHADCGYDNPNPTRWPTGPRGR